MTLEAGVWVETVTEGDRRFIAAWREEEVVDAARRRQEKREANETKKVRKVVIARGSVKNLRSDTN